MKYPISSIKPTYLFLNYKSLVNIDKYFFTKIIRYVYNFKTIRYNPYKYILHY